MPRNWKRAKNALIQQMADAFIERRMAECATLTPTMRSILKPLKMENSLSLEVTMESNVKQEIINEAPDISITSSLENEKMSAINAAKMANQDPLCTINKVLVVIPEYKAALPRRSWIAKFRAALDPEDKRFIDLVYPPLLVSSMPGLSFYEVSRILLL